MPRRSIKKLVHICDYCKKNFALKINLAKHIVLHHLHNTAKLSNSVEYIPCDECDMEFRNKGLLMCHKAKKHTQSWQQSKDTKLNKYSCQACQTNFMKLVDLRYHVRSSHFNLKSHLPYCHFKKVNQVWFEKVFNTHNIVEMKKVAHNMLLMRKLDDNTAMKVSDHQTEDIDLNYLYPTQPRLKNIQCKYCSRNYDSKYIKKHIQDVHLKYLKKKSV